MAFGDGNMLSGFNQSTKIRLNTGFTTTVENSFTISGAAHRDVTADSTPNAYSSDVATDKFRQYSGFSSTVSSSLSIAGNFRGCTHDGTNFYSSDIATTKYRKYSGFTSSVSSSFGIPGSPFIPEGLSMQLGNLYGTDSGGKIWRYTGFTSTISASFTVSGGGTLVTQDATNSYITRTTKFVRLSGFSSTILTSISAGAAPGGIEWDKFTERYDDVASSTGGGLLLLLGIGT